MAKQPDIELVSLTKRYGETVAVDSIGLRIPAVEIDDIGTTAKTLPEFTMLWERMLRG